MRPKISNIHGTILIAARFSLHIISCPLVVHSYRPLFFTGQLSTALTFFLTHFSRFFLTSAVRTSLPPRPFKGVCRNSMTRRYGRRATGART